MVANAFRRKSLSLISHLKVSYLLLLIDLKSLDIEVAVDHNGALLAHFQARPVLIDQIQEMQDQDSKLIKKKNM